MSNENFTEMLQQMQRTQQKRQAEEQVEAQIKMLTVIFDRSTAYTNLLLVGAYAGFFGLWQLTREYLSKPQALWSALLVVVSLAFFVIFEVTKMVFIQRDISTKAKALSLPECRSNPQVLTQRMNEVATAHERIGFHFMRFWVLTMFVTVGAGLAGAGVLVWSFVAGLMQ